MSSAVFPITNLQSPQSLRLGCLIVNISDIDQSIHDPFPDRPTAPEINTKELGRYHETQTSSTRSKFASFLSDVLSVSHERRLEGASSLTSPHVTINKLRNHSSWFQDACGTPETRRWLEEAMNNRQDVYLLVGFFTLKDATFVKRDTSGKVGVRGVDVPILPVGIAILNTMISITSGIRCTRDTSSGRMSLLDVPGENIFGVWYRKVKFKWSFSREIGVPSLDNKTKWKPFWEWRGPGEGDGDDRDRDDESEEEEEDILEVSLEDMSDWDEDVDSLDG